MDALRHRHDRVKCSELSGRPSGESVMESANLGELNDPTEFWRLHRSGLRRILAKRKVRPRNVVIAAIASQNSSQMALVEDHHVV